MQLGCVGRVNWARGHATSFCPPARTVNGGTLISPILLELLLIAISLRLGRPCYYNMDLSLAGDRKASQGTRRICPLPGGMRDVSLSIRQQQPLSFTLMESQHDSPGCSDNRLVQQKAKPRQFRKRRRPVTVCQHCRYLRKKCNRELPNCSYCQR